jgi:hypothetical protein
MSNIFKTVPFLVVGILVTQIGTLRGKWKEIMVPELKNEDIRTISATIDQQRDSLIDYKYKVCQAFTPCADASLRHNISEIVQVCRDATNQLYKTQIPNILPASVKKNIEVYHQSMINGSIKIADSWDGVTKDGGTFWTHIFNWEIDTCGKQSIPQKVYRLYGIEQLSHSDIVTCKEIVQLYKSRSPASQK